MLRKKLLRLLLTLTVFIAVFPALLASDLQAVEQSSISANMIKNPGFEDGLDHWNVSSDPTSQASYTPDITTKHGGDTSVKGIETQSGSLGRLYQDVTNIVEVGKAYTIGGWIKTFNVEGWVVIALDYVRVDGWTTVDGYIMEIGHVSGTFDWTYYESNPFTVPPMPSKCVSLWFLFDFNAGNGSAWWDDVFLRPEALSYDDGEIDSSIRLESDIGVGVRFDPSFPWILLGVEIVGKCLSGYEYFSVGIYDDEMNEIVIGSYECEDFFLDVNDFVTAIIEIPLLRLTNIFYIFVFSGNQLSIAYDSDPPIANRSYSMNRNTNSIETAYQDRNLMIRAIGYTSNALPSSWSSTETTIDGRLETEEWLVNKYSLKFCDFESCDLKTYLYTKNDERNLYFALDMVEDTVKTKETTRRIDIALDIGADGELEAGKDLKISHWTPKDGIGNGSSVVLVWNGVGWAAKGAVTDWRGFSFLGSHDNPIPHWTYEFKLNIGIGFKKGDKIGIQFSLNMSTTEEDDLSYRWPPNSKDIAPSTYVSMRVIMPELAVSSETIDFSEMKQKKIETKFFHIQNIGEGILEWNAFIDPPCPWINVTPNRSMTTSTPEKILIRVNTTYPTPGSYEVNITIMSNGGQKDIPVSTVVIQNSLPIVEIIEKASLPNQIFEGESIFLQGRGEDSDGNITRYSWFSSVDGSLSEEAFLNVSWLSIGTHEITFDAMDDTGEWAESPDNILLTVVPKYQVPLWQTALVVSGLSIVGIVFLGFLIYYRLTRKRHRFEIKIDTLETEEQTVFREELKRRHEEFKRKQEES